MTACNLYGDWIKIWYLGMPEESASHPSLLCRDAVGVAGRPLIQFFNIKKSSNQKSHDGSLYFRVRIFRIWNRFFDIWPLDYLYLHNKNKPYAKVLVARLTVECHKFLDLSFYKRTNHKPSRTRLAWVLCSVSAKYWFMSIPIIPNYIII